MGKFNFSFSLILTICSFCPSGSLAQNDDFRIRNDIPLSHDLTARENVTYTLNAGQYISKKDSSLHSIVMVQLHDTIGRILDTITINPELFSGTNWIPEDANITLISGLHWKDDTLCFIIKGRDTNNINLLFLVMILDKKVVKTAEIPKSNNHNFSKMAVGTQGILLATEPNIYEVHFFLFQGSEFKSIFRLGASDYVHQLILHPTDNSLLICLFDVSNDTSTLTIRKFDFNGQHLWAKSFGSRSFGLFASYGLGYLNKNEIAFINNNGYYLRNRNPIPNGTSSFITQNFSSELTASVWDDDNGELLRSKDLTNALIRHLGLPVLPGIQFTHVGGHKLRDDVVVFCTIDIDDIKQKPYSFVLDDSLELINFQSYDNVLRDLRIGHVEPTNVVWNSNGSMFVSGRYNDVFSREKLNFWLQTDTNLCLVANCVESGCMDPKAYNFNPFAKVSDGKCNYPMCSEEYFELVLTSPTVFRLDDKGGTASDTITITGSKDGVEYLHGSFAYFALSLSTKGSTFDKFYASLCLPKANPCYLLNIKDKNNKPVNTHAVFLAQINHYYYSFLVAQSTASINQNGLSRAACQNQAWESFKIYPNPATDYFTIHRTVPSWEWATLVLTDMQGKILKTADLRNSQLLKIPISSYAVGMYIVHIVSSNPDENNTYFKLIKQ